MYSIISITLVEYIFYRCFKIKCFNLCNNLLLPCFATVDTTVYYRGVSKLNLLKLIMKASEFSRNLGWNLLTNVIHSDTHVYGVNLYAQFYGISHVFEYTTAIITEYMYNIYYDVLILQSYNNANKIE